MSLWKNRSLIKKGNSNGHYMLKQQMPPSDPDAILQKISVCRSRLAQDPGDLATRVSLAWYLLFQASRYRREQEIMSQLAALAAQADEPLKVALKGMRKETAPPCPDYRRLLRESLLQAATVTQISEKTSERNEAARIRELAELFGPEQVVAEADAEAQRILARLARAICAEKREKTRIASQHRDDDDFEDY